MDKNQVIGMLDFIQEALYEISGRLIAAGMRDPVAKEAHDKCVVLEIHIDDLINEIQGEGE